MTTFKKARGKFENAQAERNREINQKRKKNTLRWRWIRVGVIFRTTTSKKQPSIPEANKAIHIREKLKNKFRQARVDQITDKENKENEFGPLRQRLVRVEKSDIERCMDTTLMADIERCMDTTIMADIERCMDTTLMADIERCMDTKLVADIERCMDTTLMADIERCMDTTLMAEILRYMDTALIADIERCIHTKLIPYITYISDNIMKIVKPFSVIEWHFNNTEYSYASHDDHSHLHKHDRSLHIIFIDNNFYEDPV